MRATLAMPDSERDEHAIIARYFAPLATHEGARGLLDDAALLTATGPLVITTDAIVEGVHFLPADPLDLVARKALRVNLSDLAAKGAAPLGYLLTLFWPAGRVSGDIALLAQGLAVDQRVFDIALLGGDTVSTPGPLSLSVTMIGSAGRRTPARAGATQGDDVYVTGTIGDSGLGLEALRGAPFDAADRPFLAARYHLPEPRVSLAAWIAEYASAAMDVSDGLIADAAKLAAASHVSMEIDLGALPLSPAAARWAAAQPDLGAAKTRLASFGDDYEILFTAKPGAVHASAVPVTRIGRISGGGGIVLTEGGQPVAAPVQNGYVHRLGR